MRTWSRHGGHVFIFLDGDFQAGCTDSGLVTLYNNSTSCIPDLFDNIIYSGQQRVKITLLFHNSLTYIMDRKLATDEHISFI